MTLIVNGETRDVAAATLADALTALDYGDAMVATALNGEFVPTRSAQRLRSTTVTASKSSRRGKEAERRTPSPFTLYGGPFASRLMLGTSQYPSPTILADAVRASDAGDPHRVAASRVGALKEGQAFWRLIRELGVHVLPKTAGCHCVKEAVTTAKWRAKCSTPPGSSSK